MRFKTVHHKFFHLVTKLFCVAGKRIKLFPGNQFIQTKSIMKHKIKVEVLFLFVFSVVIAWKNYVIVIG